MNIFKRFIGIRDLLWGLLAEGIARLSHSKETKPVIADLLCDTKIGLRPRLAHMRHFLMGEWRHIHYRRETSG